MSGLAEDNGVAAALADICGETPGVQRSTFNAQGTDPEELNAQRSTLNAQRSTLNGQGTDPEAAK